MNCGTIPSKGSSDPGVQIEFRRQMETWRELLAHCGQKPGRKYVHNLRVATLRLQASLEYWLSCQEPDTFMAEVVRRWRRQGKKLRRTLGPVRQADVSLGKLARVRSWADSDAGGHPVLPKECLGAIARIERGVKRRRAASAKKLVAEIELRRKRLNRLSRKVEAALRGFAPAAESGSADKILAQIAAVAAEFPALDSENLHDFRKGIKRVRYLAEVLAPSDSTAARQAAVLKRITGAVGEWHDWQALTEEAGRADRGNAAMAATGEFLQAQAGRSLEHALKLCGHSMMRLINGAANGNTPHPTPAQAPDELAPRKPVVAALPDLHRMHAGQSVHAS